MERLAERLVRKGSRLALAESCTGGLLAARLTDTPGASRFLVASLVTYSDDAKARLLGVRHETLAAYGAVSEQVALEMVRGAQRVCGAEVAVSITGVAGPGGGSPGKPVGTVWIGFAAGDRAEAELHHFSGERATIRECSVAAAVDIALRHLRDGE
jgi:nicotinamide-nucleotide amidase